MPLQRYNHSYFPILVGPGFPVPRDELYARLKAAGIFCRRYFYPLISEFPMYRALPSAQEANLPVATVVARQILCLPIYPGLDPAVPERIARIFVDARRG
jgi:dTDP-4-amino-4,6-dideoxygalactose transaminase